MLLCWEYYKVYAVVFDAIKGRHHITPWNAPMTSHRTTLIVVEHLASTFTESFKNVYCSILCLDNLECNPFIKTH